MTRRGIGGIAALLLLVLVGVLAWATLSRGEALPPSGTKAAGDTRSAELPNAARAGTVQRAEVQPAAADLGSVHGVVVCSEFGPVAGVTVALHPDSVDGASAAPLASVISNAAGEFSFDVEPEWPAELRLQAAGDHIVPGVHWCRVNFPVDVWVTVRIEVFGRVVSAADGNALAGVEVTGEDGALKTDAEGRYRMWTALPDGSGHLDVRKSGFAAGAVEIELVEPATTELNFALQPLANLRLQPVDAVTGVPVRESVILKGQRLMPVDPDGLHSIAYADGGDAAATVSAPGYCTTAWRCEELAGHAGAVLIPLVPATIVRGVVRDTARKPIGGVQVHCKLRPSSEPMALSTLNRFDVPGEATFRIGQEMPRVAYTSQDGGYELAVLPTAKQHLLRAAKAGYAKVDKSFKGTGLGEDVLLDFTLAYGARVVVTATYNGKPWTGRVLWRHVPGSEEVSSSWHGLFPMTASGVCELEDVGPGQIEVAAREKRSGQIVATTSLEVTPGGSHTCALNWQVDLGPLHGTVTTADGEPADSVRVVAASMVNGPLASQPVRRHYSAKTDAGGRFTIEVARDLRYWLSSSVGDGLAQARDVVVGSTTHLVIPKYGELRILVRDRVTKEPLGNGRPSFAPLTYRASGGTQFTKAGVGLDRNGRADLELPVGSVDLRLDFHGQGYVSRVVRDVPVTETRNTKDYVIELDRGLSVDFRLKQPVTAADASAHTVFFLHESELHDVLPVSDDSGGPDVFWLNGKQFQMSHRSLSHRCVWLNRRKIPTITGLKPGRYFMRAFPDDLVIAPSSFVVEKDAVFDMEVRQRK